MYTSGIYTIPRMLCPFGQMYLLVFSVLWVSMMFIPGAHTIPTPRVIISICVLCTCTRSTHNAYLRDTFYTFPEGHWIFQYEVYSGSIWCILQVQIIYHPLRPIHLTVCWAIWVCMMYITGTHNYFPLRPMYLSVWSVVSITSGRILFLPLGLLYLSEC